MAPLEKRGMEEKGFKHVIAAFKFSMAGMRVLFREEAARLEVVYLIVGCIGFWLVGARLDQYAVLFGLFLFLLMVETLNTAIELIVDRESPEISDFAKHTKDLGSFAVFCGLSIFTLYLAWVIVFPLIAMI